MVLNNSALTIRHERIENAKKLNGLKVVIFSEAICNIHLQYSFGIKYSFGINVRDLRDTICFARGVVKDHFSRAARSLTDKPNVFVRVSGNRALRLIHFFVSVPTMGQK